MTDTSAIIRVLEERGAAIREKDARKAVSYYADDIVNFDLAPPLSYRGSEATNPQELQNWFDSWTRAIGIDFDRLTVRTEGNLGFAHGYLHLTGPRTDGSETDVWARMTACLEQRNGAWKIVHEHQSFPTKMDGSGLSASDLRPE
jgi:ketosteroid isomerase-like protein